VSAPVTVTGDEDESMTYLSIGEFARASGLTAKALRLYDELELLVPAEVDQFNGYRRYAPEQLEPARLVASLRLVGMPLYRIREIAALAPSDAATEVATYWRQVEADHLSRRTVVGSLVEQLRQETQMTSTDQSWSVRAVVRHEQGGRDSQQDAVYAGDTVFAIADGFGAGATAAGAAIDAVSTLDQDAANPDPAAAIDAAVAGVSGADWPDGDGTTLTALWFTGGQVVSAHIGDCRVHRVREGRIDRLTQDHTLVAALVAEGRLTEEEASAHPHRALLNRALGADAPGEADIKMSDVRAGDRFVLTSDGVHSVVGADELSSLMLLDADPETVASGIADAVVSAQAPDNYSLVVIEVAA
jgi:serine/threonine protein phosphatase PrpC